MSRDATEVTERPTGTVTFMFTDIEGSTRLWERHPGPMRQALEQHDRVLLDAADRHVGYVFAHGGDGFGIAFTRADDAVLAAVEAQHLLADVVWPDPLDLRVRVGIHTGEAQERDGNYFGPTVNRCARLMGAARGGQVLVSNLTRELVINRLPGEVVLHDLGECSLRDIDRRERLFQVSMDDGRTPPLAPSPSTRSTGHLPTALSSFVGREHDLVELSGLLDQHRLLTIIGPAGVGKTRLAIELAAAVADTYGGAWFVDLIPTQGRADIATALARVLDVALDADGEPLDALLDGLRTRTAIVVLDNCEHVLDDVGSLTRVLLQECSSLKVLATSRARLGVIGEQVWLVEPLASSPDGDGVRLFCERAREANPTFDPRSDRAALVQRVVARLDGIPLAIELAAAQTATMTIGDIHRELDEHFLVPAGEPGAELDHAFGPRRTIAAAVAWSYRLLDAFHRDAFERLAVFSSAFDAEAVAAVGGSTGAAAARTLRSLVEQSLVSADLHGATARYRLLQPVHAWAAGLLARRPDEAELHRRHAAHYLHLAEQADVLRAGPDERVWVDQLELDLDELRAATRWSDQHGEVDLALGIYVALYELAAFQGHREIFTWIDPTSRRYRASGALLAPAALAMRALAHDVAQPASANLAEAARRLKEDQGSPDHRLFPFAEGFALASHGDGAGGVERYRDSVEVILQTEGENGRYVTARAISASHTDPSEAAELLELALRIGQPTGIAAALAAQARVLRNTDPATAITLLAAASGLAAAVRNRRQLAYNDLTMASVLTQMQDRERALATLRDALVHAEHLHQHEVVWSVVSRVHDLLEAMGEGVRADRLLQAWFRAFPAMGTRYRMRASANPPFTLIHAADRHDELVALTLDVIDAVLEAGPARSAASGDDLAEEQR